MDVISLGWREGRCGFGYVLGREKGEIFGGNRGFVVVILKMLYKFCLDINCLVWSEVKLGFRMVAKFLGRGMLRGGIGRRFFRFESR